MKPGGRLVAIVWNAIEYSKGHATNESVRCGIMNTDEEERLREVEKLLKEQGSGGI